MDVPTKYIDQMFSVPKDHIMWISDGDFDADFQNYTPSLRDWVKAKCAVTDVERAAKEVIDSKPFAKRTQVELGNYRFNCEEQITFELRKAAWRRWRKETLQSIAKMCASHKSSLPTELATALSVAKPNQQSAAIALNLAQTAALCADDPSDFPIDQRLGCVEGEGRVPCDRAEWYKNPQTLREEQQEHKAAITRDRNQFLTEYSKSHRSEPSGYIDRLFKYIDGIFARRAREARRGEQADLYKLRENAIRVLADRGDAKSQRMLGNLYFFGGSTIDKDHAEGMTWYGRAGAQGDLSAQRFYRDLFEKVSNPSHVWTTEEYQEVGAWEERNCPALC
jgi:hypothetical protein